MRSTVMTNVVLHHSISRPRKRSSVGSASDFRVLLNSSQANRRSLICPRASGLMSVLLSPLPYAGWRLNSPHLLVTHSGVRTPVRCASRMAIPPRGGGSSSSSARSAARISDSRSMRFTPGTSRIHGHESFCVEIRRPRGQDRPLLDRFEIRIVRRRFSALMMNRRLLQCGEIGRGFVFKSVHGSKRDASSAKVDAGRRTIDDRWLSFVVLATPVKPPPPPPPKKKKKKKKKNAQTTASWPGTEWAAVAAHSMTLG